MGYILRYGTAKPAKYKRDVRLFLPLTLFFIVLSLTTINMRWPKEMQILKQSLFPWTAEPVQSAVQDLRSNLSEGENLETALEVFCRQILENGG